jgi:predicted ATPase
MYSRLQLKNFKAFQELDLELRPLTLLSGMNGMGKSSVLQSLLLLRQSYLQRGDILSENGQLKLILNGDLVELGTGQDIFFDRVD